MKIVQLITRFDTLGGAQTHVLEISKSLAKDGHEVYILFSKGEEVFDLTEYKNIHCIQLEYLIHNINIVQDYRSLVETKKIFKKIKPDLVALHSSKAGIIGRLAAASLNIPTVFTAHGWSFTEGISPLKRKIFSGIEKHVAKKTDYIITVSHYDENLARDYYIEPKYKMKTIHNGINDSMTNKNDPSSEVIKIIMVARFQAPKRQDLLLSAFSKIRDHESEILLVGDGENIDLVRNKSMELNLGNKVKFLGARKDVPQLLEQSNVFVLISEFEGLPISIIEAMACGIPVIASEVGGVSELISHGENGFLVKNDELEISKYLKMLTENHDLRKLMGLNARKTYLEKFQFTKTYKETLEVYENAMKIRGEEIDLSI